MKDAKIKEIEDIHWWQKISFCRTAAFLLLIAYRGVLWLAYGQTPLPRSPLGDPIIYSNLGKAFAAGEPWPLEVVFRSPAYTYIVGGLYKAFGASPLAVLLLQNCVGLLAAFFLLEILLRLGGKNRTYFWAGLLLMLQGGVWTAYEWKMFPVSLATALQVFIIGTVWFFNSKKTILTKLSAQHFYLFLLALFSSLLIAVRPNFMLFLPLLILYALLPRVRNTMGWKPILYFALVPALVLAPFMLRNQKMGAGFNLAASSGITFYHGNNPKARGGYAAVPGVSPDVLMQNNDVLHVAKQHGAATIAEANRFWKQKGFDFLTSNPEGAFRLMMAKMLGFVSPWESGGDLPFKFEKLRIPLLRYVTFANFTFLLFFAFFGVSCLWRKQREVAYAVLALFSVSLATCLIFYMNNRYRIPAWPVLFLPATIGLAHLWQEFQSVWSSESEKLKFAVTTKCLVGLLLLVATAPISLGHTEQLAGWHNWAVMNIEAGKIKEGVASYLEVLKRDPHHRPSLSNLSRVELNAGNYDKSKFLSKHLVQKYPDSYVGWTNLSDIARKERDFKHAVRLAEKALQIRPQFVRAQASFAKSAFLAEDYHRACPMLNQLVRVQAQDELIVAFQRSCKFVLERESKSATG